MGKTHLVRGLQIGAALLIVVLAVGLYRAKSDAARTEAHLRELNAEIAEREARLRELRAEIAERESPGNIEDMAQERGWVIGRESEALPERDIANRLPAPEEQKATP